MPAPDLQRCRHCGAIIHRCNCGANYGQPHWSTRGQRASRYCAGQNRLHEPSTTDNGSDHAQHP